LGLSIILALTAGYFLSAPFTPEPRFPDQPPHTVTSLEHGLQPAEFGQHSAGEIATSEALTVLSSLAHLRGALDPAKQGMISFSVDLLDPIRPLRERQKTAWELGKLGSDEAIAILRQGLQAGPPLLRVTIAEALGNSENREARSLLRELLKDKDLAVARAAIRGIGAVGDQDSVKLLAQLARDLEAPDDMRIESALSLGKVNSPAASGALTKVLGETSDEQLVEAIVSGLAEQSFAETEGAFRALLNNAGTAIELRVAALEALGQAKGDPTILLMEQFDDPEPAIRAAAAWGLANLENLGNLAPRLLSLHAKEADPEVRARILQALQHHRGVDP
ncbi:MAG: HEAT repeat domain-containing protein, partial [Candidatus Binatia bacterium]